MGARESEGKFNDHNKKQHKPEFSGHAPSSSCSEGRLGRSSVLC